MVKKRKAAYAKLQRQDGKEHFITTWGPIKLNEHLHDVQDTVAVDDEILEDDTAVELEWDCKSRRWKCTVRAECAFVNELPYPRSQALFLESGDFIQMPNARETVYFLLPRRSPDKGRKADWDDNISRARKLEDPDADPETSVGFCTWTDAEQISLVRAIMTFGYLRPVQVKRHAQLQYPIGHVHRMMQDAVYVTWMLLQVGYEKGFLGRLIVTEEINPLKQAARGYKIGIQPENMERAGVTAEALANRIRTMLSLRWIYDQGAEPGKAPKMFEEISQRATMGSASLSTKWSPLNDWRLVKDTHEHGYGPHYGRMASIRDGQHVVKGMRNV